MLSFLTHIDGGPYIAKEKAAAMGSRDWNMLHHTLLINTKILVVPLALLSNHFLPIGLMAAILLRIDLIKNLSV